MSITIDYFNGIEDIKDEKHYKLLDDLDSLSNFKNEFHTPAKDGNLASHILLLS